MKDIPVFDTEHGVASLILKEIPYRETAYVTIQSSQEPDKLVEECVAFCRMCGAEKVFASGHTALETRLFHTAMWEMRCLSDALADTDAALWPIQEETLEIWRGIYNEKAIHVPNGAWMDTQDAREMLRKGDGYFIHRNGKLLGIGRASGDMIDWVAATQPGAGRDVVLALSSLLNSDTVRLLVASANEKAVRLYERMGFLKVKEISKWYRVL